jgi:16S rRNA (guanine966-N2)-methyltransferase
VRPTSDRVREAWMSALGGSVDDARVVDLFAGSGALGLEALSRGASRVVFVERARGALKLLRANIELLGARDECQVWEGEVFRFLDDLDEPFDVALADPPYARGEAQRLVDVFMKKPFAKELWLEHPWRESLAFPDWARTRRYGDTALTTIPSPPPQDAS